MDNVSVLAREEIFGPVLSVIPRLRGAAIGIANDSIYRLDASVFIDDVDRAASVLRRKRADAAGHNDHHPDPGFAFGGNEQSGFGHEGGREPCPILETKSLILQGTPASARA